MIRLVNFLLWGILSAGVALIIESLITIIFPLEISPDQSFAKITLFTIIIFVITEEGLRYLILSSHKNYFNLKNTALLSGLFLGLGFAITESSLNIASSEHKNWSAYLLLPAFIHTWSGTILGLSLIPPKSKLLLRIMLVIFVIAIHAIYNYIQLYQLITESWTWIWILASLVLFTAIVWASLPRLVSRH